VLLHKIPCRQAFAHDIRLQLQLLRLPQIQSAATFKPFESMSSSNTSASQGHQLSLPTEKMTLSAATEANSWVRSAYMVRCCDHHAVASRSTSVFSPFFNFVAGLSKLRLVSRMPQQANMTEETKVVRDLAIIVARNFLHFEPSPGNGKRTQQCQLVHKTKTCRLTQSFTYRCAAENGAMVSMMHVVGMNSKYVLRLTRPSR